MPNPHVVCRSTTIASSDTASSKRVSPMMHREASCGQVIGFGSFIRGSFTACHSVFRAALQHALAYDPPALF